MSDNLREEGHPEYEPPTTVSEARAKADEYVRVVDSPLSTNDPGITYATLALQAELRALALMVEDLCERVYNAAFHSKDL